MGDEGGEEAAVEEGQERVEPADRPCTRERIQGALGFNFFQHGPTTRPSVERTADKAFLLSDRIEASGQLGQDEPASG